MSKKIEVLTPILIKLTRESHSHSEIVLAALAFQKFL